MPEPKPPQPTDWIPEDKDKFDGLRGKYYPALMRQKFPGLYEKLTTIKVGEVPALTQEEKDFFIDLIMAGERGVSNMFHDISHQVWGAWSVDWVENGKGRGENTMAALWWHFCSSNLSRDRVAKAVDFYLGTTKEQAEAEIATWPEWKDKNNIKLR